MRVASERNHDHIKHRDKTKQRRRREKTRIPIRFIYCFIVFRLAKWTTETK